MKKLLSLLLALALLLSLAGCTASTPLSTDPTVTTVTGTSDATTQAPPESTGNTTEETQPDQQIPLQTRPVQNAPTASTPTKPVQTDPPQTQHPETTVPVETTLPAETTAPTTQPTEPETTPSYQLDPYGSYTSKEDVALYIHLYGKLPGNFITKSQARSYGWRKGALEPYAPGKCIGGDVFRNQEGLLPAGHTYYECDIDTLGSYSGRGSKRIVFSSDGLVYYTGNHYRTFELLYGEP